MDFITDLISTEFGLLLVLTLIVWGGFFIFMFYMLSKMKSLQKEINSLRNLESNK